MPIKLRKSATTVVRGTSQKTTVHYYMKTTPLNELIEEFNKTSRVKGKGKLNQKIRNELVRRGGIEFVPRTAETL